jgi:hypothetical protein
LSGQKRDQCDEIDRQISSYKAENLALEKLIEDAERKAERFMELNEIYEKIAVKDLRLGDDSEALYVPNRDRIVLYMVLNFFFQGNSIKNSR